MCPGCRVCLSGVADSVPRGPILLFFQLPARCIITALTLGMYFSYEEGESVFFLLECRMKQTNFLIYFYVGWQLFFPHPNSIKVQSSMVFAFCVKLSVNSVVSGRGHGLGVQTLSPQIIQVDSVP